jgi:hypothetical protein
MLVTCYMIANWSQVKLETGITYSKSIAIMVDLMSAVLWKFTGDLR